MANSLVKQEILRLSIEIALLRYVLKNRLVEGVRVEELSEQFTKLGILLIQKHALKLGRYEELPYNVRLLYK